MWWKSDRIKGKSQVKGTKGFDRREVGVKVLGFYLLELLRSLQGCGSILFPTRLLTLELCLCLCLTLILVFTLDLALTLILLLNFSEYWFCLELIPESLYSWFWFSWLHYWMFVLELSSEIYIGGWFLLEDWYPNVYVFELIPECLKFLLELIPERLLLILPSNPNKQYFLFACVIVCRTT